jgi:integrase
MGYVQRLAKGKYKLTVSQGFDASGNRIRRYKTVYADGKREAEQLLKEFEKELEAEAREKGESIRFVTFFNLWMRNYAKVKLEPSTLEIYGIVAKPILNYFRNYQLHAITTLDVEQFLNEEKTNKRGSLEKKYNVMKSIFKHAVKWRYLEHNPMEGIKKPKNPQKEIKFYDRDEIKEVLQAVKEMDNQQQLKVKLAVVGGLRRGEVLGIADDAVVWETNQIKVFRSVQYSQSEGLRLKRTKTGDSRIVTFPSWLMLELRVHYLDLLQHRAEIGPLWTGWEDTEGRQVTLLFADDYGRPLRPDSITKFWGRFMKRHPQLKRIRFQDLRHTSASLILSEGVNIKVLQKRLGHKRATTTLNVYTHITERDDRKASDIFDDFS